MKIFYGLVDNKIDVSYICLDKLTKNNIISIPSKDHERARFFTDPICGTRKNIFILNDETLTEYDDKTQVKINLTDNTIITIIDNVIDVEENLKNIHSKLKIKHGSLYDEVPEQKLAIKYLTGNEKVLEIGSNIGRNSLIIGYILREKDNNDFVTLETDPDIFKQLIENRDLNFMDFHVENSALSKRNLIQSGWETKESDILLEGYISVKKISFDELYKKYNINFDTLVIDCEGAFYYILMDMPEILNNVNLIIMENDYRNINDKIYIDNILKENNFYRDYCESGGWGPCEKFFFEVWKK